MFVKQCTIIAIIVLRTVLSESLDTLIFPNLPVGALNTTNDVCRKDSEVYLESLKNFTLWAHEMWDASAKSSTGVLRGSFFQTGSFDECLTAKAPFQTKYCVAIVNAHIPVEPEGNRDPKSLNHDPYEHVLARLFPSKDVSQQKRNSIKVGWCVPASCTLPDLKTAFNSHIDDLNLPLRVNNNVTYTADFAEILCQTYDEKGVFNAGDFIFCILTVLLILLVFTSTIYEVNRDDGEKPSKVPAIAKFFLCFSAKSNFSGLSRADESDPALTILYGLKFFCILLIILDHRFGTFIASMLLNFNFVEQEYRAPTSAMLFHGDLFVDIFFVLGGILVAYGLLGTFEKRKVNPAFLILMRYSRLTPVYAFVIFYYATVFRHTGQGPLWEVMAGQDSQDCRDNWWTNLLYISNYVNADHMCMVHSWYLPCDFHFFIMGIGICLLIQKRKIVGLFALLILTVLSIFIPFAVTLIYSRPALLLFFPEFLTGPKIHPDFLMTYIKSHTRASPYLIGLFTGYLYHRSKGDDNKMRKAKSYGILLASLILLVASFAGGLVFYDPYHEYDAVESALYAGLHRPAFALGVVGILYISSYGHASFIYNILSWSPWIPFSKLVFGAYLIHMSFAIRSAGSFNNPRFITYFDVISLGLSDMVLAFAVALALYLAIEAPFRKIFKMLLIPPPASKKCDVSNSSNTAEQGVVRTNGGINNGNCDSRL